MPRVACAALAAMCAIAKADVHGLRSTSKHAYDRGRARAVEGVRLAYCFGFGLLLQRAPCGSPPAEAVAWAALLVMTA